MHGWEKRDTVLICQGASRVQVHAGVPRAPERKKMKRIHMRMRENGVEGREVECKSERAGLEII